MVVVRKLLLLAAVAYLFVTLAPKVLLAIMLVWFVASVALGILIGKLLARRSRDYPSPHYGPKPYLYDQDHEGR
jgi:hypothetical protein